MFIRILTTLLSGAMLASCGYGPINPPPCVRNPKTAATVTVERAMTIVGAPANMFVVVEDERVYGLAMGKRITFEIDAGEHRLGYDLGFNRCRDRVLLEPGHAYLIKMTPICDLEPKDLGDECPYPRSWPTRTRPATVNHATTEGF